MNRKTKSAADKIRARIIGQRAQTKRRALEQLEKAHAVAHGAWHDFALQTSGSTVYGAEMDAVCGPSWFAKSVN